jgi:predicted secreted Zn-dependent protease
MSAPGPEDMPELLEAIDKVVGAMKASENHLARCIGTLVASLRDSHEARGAEIARLKARVAELERWLDGARTAMDE